MSVTRRGVIHHAPQTTSPREPPRHANHLATQTTLPREPSRHASHLATRAISPREPPGWQAGRDESRPYGDIADIHKRKVTGYERTSIFISSYEQARGQTAHARYYRDSWPVLHADGQTLPGRHIGDDG